MAFATSRAIPSLLMSGRQVHMKVNAQKAATMSSGHCLKQFFTNSDNRLAKFVGQTKNIDKTAKLVKSVAELGTQVLEMKGEKGSDAWHTTKNIASSLSTARTVIALPHVVNGAVPRLVRSCGQCFRHLVKMFSPKKYYDLGSEENPLAYNKLFVTRGDHALAALKEGCTALSSGAFVATFGAVRPVLFANKLAHKPFLSKELKTLGGQSVDYMMAAAHAADMVGGVATIVYENRAYQRASQGLETLRCSERIGEDLYHETVGNLRGSYIKAIKQAIFKILEKVLDFCADIFKLVPMHCAEPLRLAAIAGFTILSSGVGLYMAWQSL